MRSVRHFLSGIFGDYPEILFKLNYFRIHHSWLNTHCPKSFHEKLTYLAFHTDTSIWSVLADKLSVRDYVISKGYKDYLPVVYRVWDSAEQITTADLPNSFVLKTNHACHTNYFVREKSQIDEYEVRTMFKKWVSWNYGRETAQPHYSRIKPKIFAEQFLSDNETSRIGKSLIDYKFLCFNGDVLIVQLIKDRDESTRDLRMQFYDMDWNAHPEYVRHYKIIDEKIECPESFDLMKQVAASLSKGFPFVRVDMYQVNGRPFFGEMTFTPGVESYSPLLLKILEDRLQI